MSLSQSGKDLDEFTAEFNAQKKESKHMHHKMTTLDKQFERFPVHHLNIQTDSSFFNDENETKAHRNTRL
jgi:hypothetical protein